MGYFNQYPYEDNEELNLDYVLAKMTALKDQVNSLNSQIGAFNAMQTEEFGYCTTLGGAGWYRYDDISDSYVDIESEIEKLKHIIDVLNKGGVDNA